MGCSSSCNESKIEIIDETPEGESLIIYNQKELLLIDSTYNIPLIEINFDGRFESSV